MRQSTLFCNKSFLYLYITVKCSIKITIPNHTDIYCYVKDLLGCLVYGIICLTQYFPYECYYLLCCYY